MKKQKLAYASPVPLKDAGKTKWDACCICQKKIGEMNCPAKNPIKARRNLGYASLANNLEKLKPFSCKLESGLLVNLLDEGDGIKNTFIRREAKWHRVCAYKYLAPSAFKELLNKLSLIEKETSVEEATASSVDGAEAQAERRQTRSAAPIINVKEELCFLCELPATKNSGLHRCETKEIHQNVKQCAEELNDARILALLAEGDLIAVEAKYHALCLRRFYNKCRRQTCTGGEGEERVMCEGIAFADLLAYIQQNLNESAGAVFRMADLISMYHSRLAQLLGVSEAELPEQQRTRFREKILSHCPNLKAERTGKEIVLVDRSIHGMDVLDRAEDQDEEALAMLSFARKLRQCVLSKSRISFSGTFQKGCEEDCIPAALLALVNTVLYGSPIHTGCRATKPALTICQLMMLKFHQKMPKGEIVRHRSDREPPLPLYLALSSYGRNRDRAQIDEMHSMGLSVSSNRVDEVTSQLSRLVVERAKENDVVVPSNLKLKLFTVGALDNIDHKTTSTTSASEFHGTGISVFQMPSRINEGTDQDFLTSFDDVVARGVRSVPELPDFYTQLPDCVLRSKQPPYPACSANVGRNLVLPDSISRQWRSESPWLEYINDAMIENPGGLLNVSWAGYHASMGTDDRLPALNALLPLFRDKSTDPSMVKHGMHLIKTLTMHLNPDQVPVMCVDQPLFALCKTIQWNWPQEFGEEKFVAMLGPLHIEQAFLRILGQFLEGSGWVEVASNSGVITSGTAAGLLKVTHITKARLIHEQTVVALYSLLQDAYKSKVPEGDVSFDSWVAEKSQMYPTFYFWLTVLNLEILLLSFVRAVRKGDFSLYTESIKKMLPFFFLFDHHNYARWLSVHVKDMEELPEKAEFVHAQFQAGNFVVRKTSKPFSALGIDHAHEQNNARIKGKGGAIGVTENPSALRRWTIGGPEVSRLLELFQETNDCDDYADQKHHEQYAGFQTKFIENSAALKESFIQLENPFELESEELVAIDSRQVVSSEGVKTLFAMEKHGSALYSSFVENRLVNQSETLYEPIPRSKTKIFALLKEAKTARSKAVIADLKANVHLFSRFFIISTARDLDLKEFFCYENETYPPALSVRGALRPGNKAHLVTILEDLAPKNSLPSACDGVIIDGAFLVHMLKPSVAVRDMSEYCEQQLKPYILRSAATVGATRVDVVWDLYVSATTKKARGTRGDGVRQQNLPTKGTRPKNWEQYLRNSDNKKELFPFLGKQLLNISSDIDFVTNVNDTFMATNAKITSLHGREGTLMEEADGRIILHASDMVLHGAKSISISCSDTDILVLAISYFFSLQAKGLEQLWILFGAGANRRYIAVHHIADQLGKEKSEALRGFHAFTGCDSVSFFSSKGKRAAWSAWKDDDATIAFKKLGRPLLLNESGELEEDVTTALERYTVKLYGCGDKVNHINEARQHLFCAREKALQLIPPTASALHQHIKRAAYQGGHIWGQADQKYPSTPPLENWGWRLTKDGYEPAWSLLPPIWSACRELDRCGCTTDCSTQRCSCRKYSLSCTPACKNCKGECSNSRSSLCPDVDDDVDTD